MSRSGLALRVVGGTALALFALSAFTPLPNAVCRWVAVPAAPGPAEAIVVLGSSMSRDGMLSVSSLRRALHGMSLYRHGLAPLLVFLGPRNLLGHSQAEARATLALEWGIPPEAILTSERAWTTREEAVGVEALLAPKGVRRILLVTSGFHMRRARWLFERAGFEVLPAPLPDAPCNPSSPEGRIGLTLSLLQEWVAQAYNAALGGPRK
jgi:uncharacterized SAM-binding protein YcdF (DUF218 family)